MDARNGTLSDTDEPSLESRVADNVMVFYELAEGVICFRWKVKCWGGGVGVVDFGGFLFTLDHQGLGYFIRIDIRWRRPSH